ncbi:hypothetical protein D3C76_1510090 [compost metagenome]
MATPMAMGISAEDSNALPAWAMPMGATNNAATITPSAAVWIPLSAPAFCPYRMYTAQHAPAPKA